MRSITPNEGVRYPATLYRRYARYRKAPRSFCHDDCLLDDPGTSLEAQKLIMHAAMTPMKK